ncbi:MAG: hypothetical protein KAS78_01240 [Candidatus Pacebacteria bacterium]|nr:hypothetical protein [Candidatus Paceibacterota bacterium]
MKKLYFLTAVLICLSFLYSGFLQAAESDLAVTNNEVVGAIIYPSQWDIQVLDFSLTPTEDDILNALTIRNLGLAPYSYLEKVVLYEDDGDGIFQGWKVDTEIGNAVYYDFNQVWYWNNLEVSIPKKGKTFFVAIETKKNTNVLADRRTLQMGISPQNDANSDGVFDFATDTGIFMSSKNNGSIDGILNSGIHIIYKKTIDSLSVKSIIVYPTDGEKISENNIVITGASKDQGGSTPSLIEINISKNGEEDSIWNEVTATGQNYITWEYSWNNIEDGTYIVKTKAIDWIGNRSEENPITIIIDTVIEEPVEPEEPIEPDEPTEPEEPEIQRPAGVNDGDLIRAVDDYKVYVVNGDYKRWIQSPEIFNFYGHFGFAVVKEISQNELDYYAESWLIRADGDKKVYEVNGDGTKHWINITAEEFTASGRSWDMIYIINDHERDYYTTGADIV